MGGAARDRHAGYRRARGSQRRAQSSSASTASHVPQRPAEDGWSVPAEHRSDERLRTRRGLGEGGPEAAIGRDAAVQRPRASGSAYGGVGRHAARRCARPRGGRAPRSRPRAGAPPQSRGVQQRRARSARRRRAPGRVAAGRRFRLRVRQHRGRVVDLARAARSLHGGRAQSQPARGRGPDAEAGRGDLRREARSEQRTAQRAAERRHAVRLARRHDGEALFSARCRIRLQGSLRGRSDRGRRRRDPIRSRCACRYAPVCTRSA